MSKDNKNEAGSKAKADGNKKEAVGKSEARIQYEIVQALQKLGIFCHSVPNEAGGRSMQIQTALVAMGMRAGVADLVVWYNPPEVGYLEVKAAKGKQSERQVAFEAKCQEAGIKYAVVRSADEAIETIKAWKGEC